MIAPAYARTMAAYNAAMNARVYEAAGRLSEQERRRERGAFWGSIHATLSHLLWADQIWMSRLGDWPKPLQTLAQSGGLHEEFSAMTAERGRCDDAILAWAENLDPATLEGNLSWFSGAAGRTIGAPRALLVTHLFNHQTHHRGQVHAMLTAAGERVGDTDLPLLVELSS